MDKELEKRLDFIEVLDKLKAILHKLLSKISVVREFVKLVEGKEKYMNCPHYGYTPLGRLLKEYRTPLIGYERLVIFPRKTFRGKVVPVYEDFNRRGMDCRLVGFRNVQQNKS